MNDEAVTSLASLLIDWSALWKIVIAALIGGCGMVIAFGVVLLCLERGRTARSHRIRLTHFALAGICSAICIAAVALGIYAMAQKPSPHPAPISKPAALTVIRTYEQP